MLQRFLFYLALFFLLMRVGYEVRWKGWVKVLLLVFLTTDLFGNMGYLWKGKDGKLFPKRAKVWRRSLQIKEIFRAFLN